MVPYMRVNNRNGTSVEQGWSTRWLPWPGRCCNPEFISQSDRKQLKGSWCLEHVCCLYSSPSSTSRNLSWPAFSPLNNARAWCFSTSHYSLVPPHTYPHCCGKAGSPVCFLCNHFWKDLLNWILIISPIFIAADIDTIHHNIIDRLTG